MSGSVQLQTTSGKQSASSKQQLPARIQTRAEKRTAFAVALDNGASIAEASRIAGVSRTTGQLWKNKHTAAKDLAWAEAAHAKVISRAEAAERLTLLARREDLEPSETVAVVRAVSDLMGYNAPTRSEITQRIIPDSVMSWLTQAEQQRDAIDVNAEPVSDNPSRLAESNPPKALGE
jgi:transposase-like protein